MIPVQQILNMIQGFQAGLAANLEELRCLVKFGKKGVTYNELQFGRIPDELAGDSIRNADALQWNAEGVTSNPSATDNLEIAVKVREGAGYYPRDGWVGNSGDDPFQYVLVGVKPDQVTTPFTVYPGQAHAIKSPVSVVKIIVKPSKTATWQVSAV